MVLEWRLIERWYFLKVLTQSGVPRRGQELLLLYITSSVLLFVAFFLCFWTNIYLHLPQTRTKSPTQSQVYLHDHIHSSGNRVPTETQQRGRLQLYSSSDLSLQLLFICLPVILRAFFSLLCHNHHPLSAIPSPHHLLFLTSPGFTTSPIPNSLSAILLISPLTPLQVCKHIWLGLYDDRTSVVPDFREPQKVKEFLQEKYEKKRW